MILVDFFLRPLYSRPMLARTENDCAFHVTTLLSMREPRSLYFDHASVLLSKDVLLFAASRFEIMQIKLKRESYAKASQNVYDEWQLHRHRMARQYAKPALPHMIETPQVRVAVVL